MLLVCRMWKQDFCHWKNGAFTLCTTQQGGDSMTWVSSFALTWSGRSYESVLIPSSPEIWWFCRTQMPKLRYFVLKPKQMRPLSSLTQSSLTKRQRCFVAKVKQRKLDPVRQADDGRRVRFCKWKQREGRSFTWKAGATMCLCQIGFLLYPFMSVTWWPFFTN